MFGMCQVCEVNTASVLHTRGYRDRCTPLSGSRHTNVLRARLWVQDTTTPSYLRHSDPVL